MGEFVRQQIPVVRVFVPFGEGIGLAPVLARLMMLETLLMNLIAQRIEKIVVRIMVRSEEPVRLLHEMAGGREMFGLYREQLRPVGKQVEVDRHGAAGIKIESRCITSRVHRTVDE